MCLARTQVCLPADRSVCTSPCLRDPQLSTHLRAWGPVSLRKNLHLPGYPLQWRAGGKSEHLFLTPHQTTSGWQLKSATMGVFTPQGSANAHIMALFFFFFFSFCGQERWVLTLYQHTMGTHVPHVTLRVPTCQCMFMGVHECLCLPGYM